MRPRIQPARRLLALALVLAPAAAPLQERDLVTIQGTAVRVDPDGSEHEGLDGSFAMTAQAPYVPEVRVEVKGGRWSARVPRDELVAPLDLVLGGRSVLLYADWTRAEEGAELALRGKLVEAPTALRVVAAEDGRELEEIEIVDVGPEQHFWGLTEGDRVASSAASPVTLTTRDFEEHWMGTVFWLRAPGRAWTRVELDPLRGGELRVELHRGGDVELGFGGLYTLAGARLLFASAADTEGWIRNHELRPGDARIEGLLPGAYIARVVRGHGRDCPSLGSAQLEVVAGETTRVKLELADPVPPEPGGRLLGAVAGAEAWLEAPCWISIRALDDELDRWVTCTSSGTSSSFRLTELPRLEDGTLAWSWNAPYAGRYLVRVSPLEQLQLVDVVRATRPVRIELPAPARLTLRLLDAETRAPVELERGWWLPVVPQGLAGEVRWQHLESGGVEQRLPSGAVELCVDAQGYRRRLGRVELAPGTNALEWRLERAD